MQPNDGMETGYERWETAAQRLLIREMKQRKLTYKLLARRLEALGINELPDQINRKVNRRRFSAAFLLACLAAIGVTEMTIPGLPRATPTARGPLSGNPK